MWERLHRDLAPLGLTVVTVALDVRPSDTTAWIAAADLDGTPREHVALIDPTHATGRQLGFTNVPMAVWVDEHGRIVRPAEQASLQANPLKAAPIPDGLDDRMRRTFQAIKDFPDSHPDDYRAAIVDFAEHGSASRFALEPHEVLERSGGRPEAHARAAACFELGEHLRRTVGHDAAVPWWREAHRLFPENWTYKRQAWTLVTTPEGAGANDLLQGPNDVYEGSWLEDVERLGAGSYYPPLSL